MKIPGTVVEGGGTPTSALEFLVSQGFQATEAPLDGEFHRYVHHCGPGEAAWAVLHSDPPGGTIGCFRCGLRAHWSGLGRPLTKEELDEYKQREGQRKAVQKARQEALADVLTNRIIPELPESPPDHPYLLAKSIKPCGARVRHDAKTGCDILIIPLQDTDGTVWTAQGIAPAPMEAWGGRTKSFEAGGKQVGTFFPIGDAWADHSKITTLFICEGFATGATIHEATGLPVACAMSANNLKPVAKALRSFLPAAAIILAGDNDRHTEGNPGEAEADTAALSIESVAIVPDFGEIPPGKDATDFNDLARLRGIEAVMEQLKKVAPPARPECIYDTADRGWWSLGGYGDFIPVSETSVRHRLHISGMSRTPKKDEPSAIDLEVNHLIHDKSVCYAGVVAGWPRGIHWMGGRSVLVTSGCKLPMGAPGEWKRMEGILLNAYGPKQFIRLIIWLHVHRRRILTQRWHPTPALATIGERGAGKSLLQGIVTLTLGGRVAKPALFLSGRTDFNEDLFAGEHLMFEDESGRADQASRRHLGESIKTLLFCRTVQCHGKRKKGFVLSPYWAMTFSLNNEPEHLMVLPPIDESLKDKILIIKAEKKPRPVPPGMTETDWLTMVLEQEIRAFIWFVDHFNIDLPELAWARDPRTIVGCWQHPEIMGLISDLTPEVQLLAFIDDVLFAEENLQPLPVGWKGTAERLSRTLRESKYSREVEKLLSWPAACGVYLGRLARQKPERVSQERKMNSRDWIIRPQASDEDAPF